MPTLALNPAASAYGDVSRVGAVYSRNTAEAPDVRYFSATDQRFPFAWFNVSQLVGKPILALRFKWSVASILIAGIDELRVGITGSAANNQPGNTDAEIWASINNNFYQAATAIQSVGNKTSVLTGTLAQTQLEEIIASGAVFLFGLFVKAVSSYEAILGASATLEVDYESQTSVSVSATAEESHGVSVTCIDSVPVSVETGA